MPNWPSLTPASLTFLECLVSPLSRSLSISKCSQGFHCLAAQVQGEQTAHLPALAVTCGTLSLTLVAAKETWSPAFLMSPQPQMPASCLSSTQKCQVSKFYQQEVIVSFEEDFQICFPHKGTQALARSVPPLSPFNTDAMASWSCCGYLLIIRQPSMGMKRQVTEDSCQVMPQNLHPHMASCDRPPTSRNTFLQPKAVLIRCLHL